MAAGRYYLRGKCNKGHKKAWYNKSVQLPQLWDGIIKVISLERDYMSTQFVSFTLDHYYAPRLNPIPKETVVSHLAPCVPNLNNKGGKAGCHDNGTKFTCAYNGFRLSGMLSISLHTNQEIW